MRRRSATLRSGRAALLALALAGCAQGSPAVEGASAGGATTGGGGGDGSGGAAPIVCSPGLSLACYTGPAGTEGVGLCVGGTTTCNAAGTAYGPCVGEVTPVPETCATPGDDNCNGVANEGGPGCGCRPGSVQPCYSGPPSTEDVGICHGGTQTCGADGLGYGACEGEVTPQPESCDTPVDDNCNGLVNEGGIDCVCAPSSTAPCYTGPAGTEGVGACHGGTQTCDDQGTAYGPCTGEVTPTQELCSTPVDDDCNGLVNEGGPDCVCLPGSTAPCYDGPAGTEGVGICQGGTKDCNGLGTAYGPCLGEVTPQPETCETPVDDNCNGLVNEGGPGCVCLPGSTAPCYDGPAGTEGVGICHGGTQTCNALGKAYGPCLGEVTPQPETCTTPVDDNCNGLVNEGGPGCVCAPGSTAACYDGPAGTAGVGVCHGGTHTCAALGTAYGPCVGETTPTAEDCATAADESCDGVGTCPGNCRWTRQFVTANVYGTAVDPSGNVVIVGDAETGTDLGAGPGAGPFLLELDPSGKYRWSLFFSSGNAFAPSLVAADVAVDSGGNVVFAGTFTNALDFGAGPIESSSGGTGDDAFVVEISPTGDLLWSRVFGADGASVQLMAVTVDADGAIVAVGGFADAYMQTTPVDFGDGPHACQGSNDTFVVKLGPAGDTLWSRTYGGVGYSQAWTVATGPGREIVVGGTFSSPIGGAATVDFGLGPLVNAGASDVFVAKLDPSGGTAWAQSYGDAENQWIEGVGVDPGGAVFVGGNFVGSIDLGGGPLVSVGNLKDDVYLAKLDASGSHLWSKRFGDAGADGLAALAVDGAGNVVIVGVHDGVIDLGGGPLPSYGGFDVYLAKLDASGNHLWSGDHGDASAQYASDVAVDGAGNVIAVGTFQSSIDFGCGPVTEPVSYHQDVFVTKVSP